MKKSFISVIVPTYNRADLISETIESILNQTYKNFELIIVDDGSTDNTEEVIRKFKDSRIKYIKTDNWGGPARPRNIGIKKAKGEYIAFCDDDDIWLPEKLEKQIRVFQISNETAMLYTRFKTIEGDVISNKIFPENGKYKSGNIFKSIYLRNLIACSGVIVKRSVLDQVGLFNTDPNLIAIEDADLWLRISLKYIIKCTDDLPLLIYRIQSQSISQGFIQRTKRSIILRKRYKKYAGNYLFCMAILLKILRMIKQ
jgi:glycosyltransferase involved in cell wall biosynthesis